MTPIIHPIIQRYAKGEISAMQAADLFGGDTNVADVIVMLRQAGLSPPRLSPEAEQAELERAERILGIGRFKCRETCDNE